MGNCALSFQRQKAKLQMVTIMTVDGKVLAYRPPPLKVHEALSEFSGGHAISESLPVVQHLDPEADMLGGNIYYLLPQQQVTDQAEKNERGTRRSIVRIRLVVSKKELKEMLISKGGVSTLGEMIISELQSRPGPPALVLAAPPPAGGGGHSDRRCYCRISWKPALESIPETNDD